jgi:hypothetical protein
MAGVAYPVPTPPWPDLRERWAMANATSSTMVRKTSKVETAAMVGSTSNRIPSHIRLGRVMTLGVLKNNAMISSSKEVRKAKKAAAASPGAIKGKTTRLRVTKRLAPRLIAACSRMGSIPLRVALTMTTT